MRISIPSLARWYLLWVGLVLGLGEGLGQSANSPTPGGPLASKRERLRGLVGAVDAVQPPIPLQVITNALSKPNLAETDSFSVQAVRWPVFEGVTGEGLLVIPRRLSVARVMALPDPSQSPEQLVGLAPGLAPERQYGRRLAEHGCEVLVPVLIDNEEVPAPTPLNSCSNALSRREWLCRLGYPFGRHVLGLELQKVLAGLNCFERGTSLAPKNSSSGTPPRLLNGLVGYGGGGQLAFCCAALAPQIDAVLLSGCFGSHPHPWKEPVTRQVYGLLPDFADAQLATLIAPRVLIVEYSVVPGFSASSSLTPDFETVEMEFERARKRVESTAPQDLDHWQLISGTEGMTTGPASDRALVPFLKALGLSIDELKPPGKSIVDPRSPDSLAERQRRQFKELVDFLQSLARNTPP